jgi:hypothetical protein
MLTRHNSLLWTDLKYENSNGKIMTRHTIHISVRTNVIHAIASIYLLLSVTANYLSEHFWKIVDVRCSIGLSLKSLQLQVIFSNIWSADYQAMHSTFTTSKRMIHHLQVNKHQRA